MNLPQHAPSSLSQADEIQALIPSATRILQKDFELSNITCNLSAFEGNVYQLRDALVPVVEQTGGPGSEAFYRLMYRIDIPEKRVAEVLQAATDQPLMSRIAEMVVIRALQKAWYRLKFG